VAMLVGLLQPAQMLHINELDRGVFDLKLVSEREVCLGFEYLNENLIPSMVMTHSN
jgi:hypothetical protein